jgi:tRNA(Ile)-lysidine synthetase-like protein
MTSLNAEVRAYITAQRLIGPGAPVVVAVSGGPDSLCLLHVLNRLCADLGFTLHIAHLDHQIRGEESAAEARFVAGLAHDWGLPATVAASDVPEFARAQRLNLHAAARVARYTFLAQVAQSIGAQAVAVAHHANDQAETVLLHLLRGAGAEGLRGMRPAVAWEEWAPAEDGGWKTDDGIRNPASSIRYAPSSIFHPARLIRPLLQITREQIERYCAEHHLEPRQDPSNFDLDATRNRLRHDLLPHLIEYNPHVVAALGRTAAICADEHDFIGKALDAVWPRLASTRADGIDIDGAVWHELHPALQRAALRRAHALLAPGATLGLQHVEHARALIERGVGRRAELPGGIVLTAGYGGAFTLGVPALPAAPQLAEPVIELPREGRVDLGGGWAIEIARRAGPPPAATTAWEVVLDAATLAGPLVARRRRPGDRLALSQGSRRLQDLFVDAKVPRPLRADWPIIATPVAVVWVAGLRAAERFQATPESRQIIRIRVVDENVGTLEGWNV